jgi:hypothetical protein
MPTRGLVVLVSLFAIVVAVLATRVCVERGDSGGVVFSVCGAWFGVAALACELTLWWWED